VSDSASAQLAARLDRLPSSRTVWSIVVLISLGGVFEFYDLFFTAYVAPGMVNSRLFTPESLGFFSSLGVLRVSGFGTFVFSTFAGLWVGVVAFGQSADRFGRKAVFTWSLVWYVAATAIMAFQSTGQWINVWRFIAGAGFGVQLVTVDTYLVELTPSSLRGRAFCVNQCICFCIVPVVALLSWLLVPKAPFGFEGWRWVVLFGTVGAIPYGHCARAFRRVRVGLLPRGASMRRSASSRRSNEVWRLSAPGRRSKVCPASGPPRSAATVRSHPSMRAEPPSAAACKPCAAPDWPSCSRRDFGVGR